MTSCIGYGNAITRAFRDGFPYTYTLQWMPIISIYPRAVTKNTNSLRNFIRILVNVCIFMYSMCSCIHSLLYYIHQHMYCMITGCLQYNRLSILLYTDLHLTLYNICIRIRKKVKLSHFGVHASLDNQVQKLHRESQCFGC